MIIHVCIYNVGHQLINWDLDMILDQNFNFYAPANKVWGVYRNHLVLLSVCLCNRPYLSYGETLEVLDAPKDVLILTQGHSGKFKVNERKSL